MFPWLARLDAFLVDLYGWLFFAAGINTVQLFRSFGSLAGLRRALKQTGRDEKEFVDRWIGHTLLFFLLAVLISVAGQYIYPSFKGMQVFVTVLFLPAMFFFWYSQKPFSEITKRLTSINSSIPFLASSVRASLRTGDTLPGALREGAFAGEGYLFQEIAAVVAEADSTGDVSSALMHLAERSPSRELTKLVNVFLEAASGVNTVSSLDSFIERNRALKRTKLLEYQKVSDTISVTTPMFTLILFIVEVMVLFASIFFIKPETVTSVIGVTEAFLIPLVYIFSLIHLQEANPGV